LRGQSGFGDSNKPRCWRAPRIRLPGWSAALNRARATRHGRESPLRPTPTRTFQAMRSPDESYRTAPLRALWDMQKIHKGGFYHDGRFPTLYDVVRHYDRHFQLGLSQQEVIDLIEYLKSI
jgi:cytochrome c peroxidase